MVLCAVLGLALLVTAPFTESSPRAQTQHQELLDLYLYHFLLFVDWPVEHPASAKTITLGVLGRPGASLLFKHLHGKPIRGKTLFVHHVTCVTEIDRDWNVLFIRRSNRSEAAEAVRRLKGSHCLTVSDIADFTKLGGMVEFVVTHRNGPSGEAHKEGRTTKRFRIHLNAVLEAELRIRSRLLRLSDIQGNVPDGKTNLP